jgi:uncharacterized membrane protein
MRMSDRVSGRQSRLRLAARTALVLGLVGLVAGPAAPFVGAADSLTVTTPYPAIVGEPGSTATFKLSLHSAVDSTVSLTADGVPSGWNARFQGSGTAVDSVFVPATGTPPDVSLNVDIPADAAAGPTTINVRANGGDQKATLAVIVRVESAATGSVSLASDFASLQGSSSSTFSFNLTLKNGTPTESTFSIAAQGPDGWTVTAKPAGQAQATSLTVGAGSSGSISVVATPAQDATAGDFPIKVTISGAGKTAEADLNVTITGSYSLSVSTPDQVLSTTANAGTEKDLQVAITNGGSAPVTAIAPSANAPTNWKVTFDPATIDSVDTQKTQPVTAKIIPSADAIAGDYNVIITAAGKEASANVTIRVRVETPQLWWIAGVVLLVATFAGLYWVFRTYGRR